MPYRSDKQKHVEKNRDKALLLPKSDVSRSTLLGSSIKLGDNQNRYHTSSFGSKYHESYSNNENQNNNVSSLPTQPIINNKIIFNPSSNVSDVSIRYFNQ